MAITRLRFFPLASLTLFWVGYGFGLAMLWIHSDLSGLAGRATLKNDIESLLVQHTFVPPHCLPMLVNWTENRVRARVSFPYPTTDVFKERARAARRHLAHANCPSSAFLVAIGVAGDQAQHQTNVSSRSDAGG